VAANRIKAFKINLLQTLATHVVCAWSKKTQARRRGVVGGGTKTTRGGTVFGLAKVGLESTKVQI